MAQKEALMRSRILVGAFALAGVLASGTVATSGDRVMPPLQSAIVYLSEPTLIGSRIVQGPVLFTHDDTNMARGKPCTEVHLFDLAKGRLEKIVSFHCIPTPRTAVRTFTLTTEPNVAAGFGCVLTAFQFAGDVEAHGVPAPVDGPGTPQ
jgi:hypothetical protein